MSLILELDRALPPALCAGTATAVYCAGACFDTDQPITGLQILVDGVAHRASAFARPRPDLVAERAWPPHALRSGFWAIVPIAASPHAGGAVVLEILASLGDGSRSRIALGSIGVVNRASPEAVPARPARPEGETIAVCMATFAPDMELLEAQVQSLRAQSDQNWICLISDDASAPGHYERVVELIGGDPRFAISRSERRQGFYRNFERALQGVPASADLIALCDQDDRWHPDKLAVLRARLGGAILVYSDQRLVQADGRILRDTLWRGRSNNYENLASMLVANTITGAATLFRRELLELALPFPDTPGFQFHDAWLSVMALAAGRVAYVDRPLYDYVQHPRAVFGDVTHGGRPPGPRAGELRAGLARLRSFPDTCRAAYFYGYLGRHAQAEAALARCGATMDRGKRRTLRRFVACDRSPAAGAWLALRTARLLLGHTETLGSEWGLVWGLAWKGLAGALARRPRLARCPLADASLPPPQSFSQRRLRRWRSRL